MCPVSPAPAGVAAPGPGPAPRSAPTAGRSLFACLVWGLLGSAALAAMSDERAVPFATIARGIQSGVRHPLRAVVRTAEDWALLWTRHAGPSAAPPRVDFDSEMVVAVFAGERRTGGYELEITRVLATDRGLSVVHEEHTPRPGAIVSQVLTAPFHVIRMPRSAEPVAFVEERE